MTHLGVCMSIASHRWGLDVVLFDTDRVRAQDLLGSQFVAAEPGLRDFLDSHPGNYRASTALEDVHGSDLILIAIDTVFSESGEHDDHAVVAFVEALSAAIPSHVPIVIASQVRPGFTRAHSKIHSELYYLMETLIFGRGLERACFPERYVVGHSDANQPLPEPLQRFLELAKCPVHVMSLESAELSKLSANFILAANITAANSLADLAQRIGANWDDIERGLRDDQRLGSHSYITAGLGIGGANITRDLQGVLEMSERAGADSQLAKTVIGHSAYMRNWALRTLTHLRKRHRVGRLAILGLAYKPGTASTRNGAGIDLARIFCSELKTVIHDPVVQATDLDPELAAIFARDLRSALKGANAVVVTTPYPEYRVALVDFMNDHLDVLVIDPFRLLDGRLVKSPSRLFQLGVNDV